jgi:hypothetical protein
MVNNLRIEFLDPRNGVDLVEISRVGDGNSVIYKVSEKVEWLENHFPEEYKAFCSKGAYKAKETGTPLNQLKSLSKAQVKNLRSQNVKTVDQLANLSDASANALGPGMMDFRKLAKQFLAEKNNIKPEQVVG